MGVDMSAEKGKRLDATPRMRPHRCYEVTHLVPGGAAAASGQVVAKSSHPSQSHRDVIFSPLKAVENIILPVDTLALF